MITFQNGGKRFGHKLLFEELSWMITADDRVGLVGANGTGKSTLLKVIGGLEQLDSGELSMQKGIGVGYLPQDGLAMTGRTVFEECLSVFSGLKQIEQELESLLHRMSDLDPTSQQYHDVADRYQLLDAKFHAHAGYALDAQVGTVLSGLGFPKDDWSRRTEEFSGGWQMRIALAKLLLEKPNVLLLDEPTNHLDLEARNWLEEYLHSYPFAYVLISHDRFFLDATVHRIAEIWNKRVTIYNGNYSKYLAQKEERLVLLQAAQKNQQDRIEQLEAFINRFRYQATKAKQVQSRIKELEKIERIELPPEEKAIHFSFPQPKASGRVVIEAHGIAKSYGDKVVFRDARFAVERGDRIALVGVNGAGKSTLIKLLCGVEPPTTGELRLGHNVEVDYFAQDQYKALDTDAKIIDDLREVAPRRTETELRNLLGCFLFSEDDVFKRIGVLSGGERNRYALARMLLQPSNFVLLDEPTNHLDMRAKDVLLNALREYTGTVVFVSHDRYFIDQLATRIFEIGNGEVAVYPGNYEDYLWRKNGGPAQVTQALEPVAASPVEAVVPAAASNGKRLNPQALKKLQDRSTAIEARLAALEQEITAIDERLGNFVSVEETQRLSVEAAAKRAEISTLEAEWTDLQESIETS
ncbi:MAG: ABC-F family ATP-binding cassette domain-containing protein [Bryobacteraceae bacterium]|nr:ABC-F family ATP-binding cassette domain-containing protein [Bryobacteraceae bacterium]